MAVRAVEAFATRNGLRFTGLRCPAVCLALGAACRHCEEVRPAAGYVRQSDCMPWPGNVLIGLGLSARCAVGMNWFCSGYTKALAFVQHRILPRLALRQDQFVMVVTPAESAG